MQQSEKAIQRDLGIKLLCEYDELENELNALCLLHIYNYLKAHSNIFIKGNHGGRNGIIGLKVKTGEEKGV